MGLKLINSIAYCLFRLVNINVNFKNYPPNNLIDTTFFEQDKYSEIDTNGLQIYPIKIIHCASIHYQSRFKNSLSWRLANAYTEIHNSFQISFREHSLILTNNESAELKQSSSEVIAVGLCVTASTKLFNISYNKVNVINERGKRCDFHFEKNSRKYVLESKGRSRSSDIESAVKDIFKKKAATPEPIKFGMISHLPRDGQPVSMTIVDPETDGIEVSRDDSIIRLLIYYSKAARLAGFWRLSDLLNERIHLMQEGVPASQIENIPLDYQKVSKMGISFRIFSEFGVIETFFPSDNSYGFKPLNSELDDQLLFFSLDHTIINILEKQDFNSLLEYRSELGTLDIIEGDRGFFSINDDGTILGLVSNNFFRGLDSST